MKRLLVAVAALAMAALPEARAALMNTITLKPGSLPQTLYGGDLRVCNDTDSTGAVTIKVRPEGMISLAPGSCFNEWGPMLTFINEGSGVVVIHYRSISKNNGRVPGHQ
jgi:hypothetical protein